MSETKPKSDLKVAKEITLPVSQKKVKIFEGKGKHAITATRMCGGKQEDYLPALMSQLVEIDGKLYVPEDFAELHIKDYNAIQSEIVDVNF